MTRALKRLIKELWAVPIITTRKTSRKQLGMYAYDRYLLAEQALAKIVKLRKKQASTP